MPSPSPTDTHSFSIDTPILVYDDDCGFCTRSARFIRRHSGGSAIDIVGFSDLTPEQRARLPVDFRDCAHLITDETVYSCGEAVEQAFARTKLVPIGLPRVLDTVPGYPLVRERGYRLVADNRGRISRLLP